MHERVVTSIHPVGIIAGKLLWTVELNRRHPFFSTLVMNELTRDIQDKVP